MPDRRGRRAAAPEPPGTGALRQRGVLRQQLAAAADGPYPGASAACEQAARWRALAVDLGDRILEAECLLLPGRWLMAVPNPPGLLADVALARQIFLAHDRLDMLPICDTVAGRAWCDLGRARQAMDLLRQVCDDPMVHVRWRGAALMVFALCLGQLGRVDEALAVLTARALPKLRLAPRCLALAQAETAVALLRLWTLVRQRTRANPSEESADDPVTPAPEEVLQPLERARLSLPAGTTLPLIDMGRLLAMAVWPPAEPGSAAPDLARQALIALALRLQAGDAAMAGWCHAAAAAVSLLQHDEQAALAQLAAARHLATQCSQGFLLREVTSLEFAIAKSRGATVAALSALQEYARLTLHGLLPVADGAGDQAEPGSMPTATLARQDTALRFPEPAHVRRAVAFINATPGFNLTVADVAAHGGVSRRTLEMAFITARGIGLGQYIRQCRLRHAAGLLRASLQPQHEVASAVGYRSTNAFAREFLAQYGQLPSVWRRNHQC